MKNIKAIGLCGLARSGKDTFFSIIEQHFIEQKISCKKLSFAHALRKDVHEFLLNKTGIDSFTEVEEEKNIIRDFLVAYGTKLMRRIDETYWISKVKGEAEFLINSGCIPIFTDVRYPNELKWIKYGLGGSIIHIRREGIVPPNEEETVNDPLLQEMADLLFYWDNFKTGHASVLDIARVQQKLNKLNENSKRTKTRSVYVGRSK